MIDEYDYLKKIVETEKVKLDRAYSIGVHIVIDNFSATFPFICYEEDSEYKIIDEIILMACEFFNIQKDEVYKEDFAMHRFMFQYKLSDHITLRLCGPELKKVINHVRLNYQVKVAENLKNYQLIKHELIY